MYGIFGVHGNCLLGSSVLRRDEFYLENCHNDMHRAVGLSARLCSNDKFPSHLAMPHYPTAS